MQFKCVLVGSAGSTNAVHAITAYLQHHFHGPYNIHKVHVPSLDAEVNQMTFTLNTTAGTVTFQCVDPAGAERNYLKERGY